MFQQQDLHLYEKSMFAHRFHVTDVDNNPLDLTGYEARLELRREPGATLLYESTSDPTSDLTVNPAGYIDLEWNGYQTDTFGSVYGPVLKYDLFTWCEGVEHNAALVRYCYVVIKPNITVPVSLEPEPEPELP